VSNTIPTVECEWCGKESLSGELGPFGQRMDKIYELSAIKGQAERWQDKIAKRKPIEDFVRMSVTGILTTKNKNKTYERSM
jgi:hypothetical protein